MLESAWLFVGCLGVLATVGALVTSDDGVAIIAGVAGAITWGVWTYGTLDLVVVGDSVTYTFTMPSLTLLGLMLALIPSYVALTGPVELVGRAVGGAEPEDL